MGNYLVACAVSGLNLHPDEEIVVVPLFRQEYPLVNGLHEGIRVDDTDVFLPARKCGRRPTDIYQIGLPFAARYDEAGGFHLDDESQAGANWLVSNIGQYSLQVTDNETTHDCRGEFIPRDLPQKPHDALRAIQTAVRNGYLILGRNSHEKFSLSFAFVQKNVFDYVKGQSPVRATVEEQIARNLRYVTTETTLFMANIQSHIEGVKDPRISAKRQEYAEKCKINMPFDRGFYGPSPNPPAFMSQVGKCRHSWRSPESRAQYAALLHAKLDALDLNTFMDETLHKCWQPSMWAGDQPDNTEMIRFGRFIENLHRTRQEVLFGEEFEDLYTDPLAANSVAGASHKPRF